MSIAIVLLCLLFSSSSALANSKHKKKAQAPEPPPPQQELPLNFVVPTADSLAKELGKDPKDLAHLTEVFAEALSEGVHGKSYLRLCAQDEDVCRMLADFFSQLDTGKREDQDIVRRRIKHFHVTDQTLDQSERFDFNVLVNAMKIEDEAEFLHLAEKSLKVTSCPRNISAALSIRAEEYFPLISYRELSKRLFEHAKECLTPTEESFERLFLRQGLYALSEGDLVHAEGYLKKATEAKASKERYRVLYWLGWIARENKVVSEENKSWLDLLNEFPLSFYAIDAAVAMGKDPIAVITNRKIGGMKRSVEGDEELNKQIRWLEALFIYKKYAYVGKWASWIVRANEDLDVDALHYLSTLKIASGLYRSNISMLFNYFKKNPAALNEEGLKLLYPRPFFNLIQDASRDKIDTYLVLGLVRQESAFEARAVSHTNARGLMQIEPSTARKLASQSRRKLNSEKDNTLMGVKYLLQLSQQFQGSVELVLASYNAGPMRVVEWLKRNPGREKNPLLWNDLIPFMETRDYVVSILRNNYFYTRLYGASDAAPIGTFRSEVVQRLLASTIKKK